MEGKATLEQPSASATSSERLYALASNADSPSGLLPLQTGPTAGAARPAGKAPAVVLFASPDPQPPRVRHSRRISGPPAWWIAPSTPPPPSRLEFAALTIASVDWRVRSPRM